MTPPEWRGAFVTWSKWWVRGNGWRVARVMGSSEDMLQECALVFCKVRNRYSAKVDNEAWLMALFQQAVRNHWTTVAIENAKLKGTQHALPDDYEVSDDGYTVACYDLNHRLKGEVRHFLDTILGAPREMLDILFGTRSPVRSNRRLCRVSGIYHTDGRDAYAELRRRLKGPVPRHKLMLRRARSHLRRRERHQLLPFKTCNAEGFESSTPVAPID